MLGKVGLATWLPGAGTHLVKLSRDFDSAHNKTNSWRGNAAIRLRVIGAPTIFRASTRRSPANGSVRSKTLLFRRRGLVKKFDQRLRRGNHGLAALYDIFGANCFAIESLVRVVIRIHGCAFE